MEFEWGRPLDISAVRNFEARHSVRFPSSYIEIVLQNDGANLPSNSFTVKDPLDGGELAIGFAALIPFVQEEGRTGNDMEKANSGGIDGLPSKVIAFGRDGGRFIIAFDYRQGQTGHEPPVVCYSGSYPDECAVIPAAASFTEFMKSLVEIDDDYEEDGQNFT